MKKTLVVLTVVALMAVVGCGKAKKEVTPAPEKKVEVTTSAAVVTTSAAVTTPVAVTTVAASNIAQTTATLNGTVTAGTNPVVAEGFQWKLTTNGTYANLAGTVTGTVLTGNLTSLTANTSYTYKAFAVVGTDTTYGAEMTFTTLAPVVVTPPTVTTVAATGVTTTTATLNGTVAQGTNPVTAR